MTKDEFKRWYSAPIKALLTHTDHRIGAMIIAIAVLEAYLRAKFGAGAEPRGHDGCLMELEQLFPELHIPAEAKKGASYWWFTFRNGFLHQVTFNTAIGTDTLYGVIEHGPGSPPACCKATSANTYTSTCNPKAFCRRVVDLVLSSGELAQMGIVTEVSVRNSLSTGNIVLTEHALTQSINFPRT